MPKASPMHTMAKILTTSIPYPKEAPTLSPTREQFQKPETEASVVMPMEALKVKPQRENDK